MSAPAPKKKTPKKRTPTQRAADHQKAFDEFRARAHGAGVRADEDAEGYPPYIVTADQIGDGNQNDVVFAVPATLSERVELTRMISYVSRLNLATQNAEAMAVIPDILIAYSSPMDLHRILIAFDQFPDSDELLFGLAIKVIEHFGGKGVVDVPGGSNAS
ncbi:hypothetical protein [Gordonia sp. (in: high G+C Gram-positive bacteria)]|uniref:hypothetical protein n=1 Tax=Gordonia sp. (in: high G+C Gram-positive bacteria) TaxID=84139 RepID=UPI0039E228C2